MAIKTNHSTESLTPDNGVLSIDTDGAIKLPVGPTTSRPSGIKGLVRFSNDIADPEYHDGIDWQVVSNKVYVDTADQNLQNQIDYIVSNLDPAALDSLTEIVQAFQNADIDITTAITTLNNSLATETQNRIDGDADLDTRVITIENQVNGKIGDLTTLTTDEQGTIVGAINEVDANLDAFELTVNDTFTNLTLDDLSDVTITTPTDGQVLVYDVATGQFRTQTQAMSVITKTFTADGVTLDFDIETSVSSIHNIVVTVNGIQQEPFYSFVLTNNTIITFDEAPEQGDKIQVKILRTSAQTDRPRPRVTNISYGTLNGYATFTITATDITYGTGVKIGDKSITRLDYISANQIQAMISTSLMNDVFWNTPQDLTLIDTSGNEFVYKNLIYYGENKPQFTNSNTYIGSFSSGDSINFALPINNSTSITLAPAYAGDTAITWLSVSGTSIVGTAPQNSSTSRYEISVTASNGSVNITKNYWLLVV